jgi:hypothetical protein
MLVVEIRNLYKERILEMQLQMTDLKITKAWNLKKLTTWLQSQIRSEEWLALGDVEDKPITLCVVVLDDDFTRLLEMGGYSNSSLKDQ